ncbi:unnamed protein product [Hermetia illucens]|uniref:tRNA N(3)-methylcytidine methyltransferase n=2 Tax=Hermetia illucens TaxID=343691 RepID=A0A7R8ULZ5_HERIL|nr:unnamed protein product [Hermetia illucens]
MSQLKCLVSINVKVRKGFCYEHTRHRKKPPGGSRVLKRNSDIFSFNAWDNVEWDDEQEAAAREAVSKNSSVTLSEDQVNKFENDADKFWDSFYDIHENRFFKDRHWLFTEFPELAPDVKAPERVYSDNTTSAQKPSTPPPPRRIFEPGCGVGNTILPILKYSQDANLKVYGCDFSAKAIDILKEHADFDSKRCEAFVMDATNPVWDVPFEENSIDIIVLIFVLSAIHPDKMKTVAENCYKYLKPGGLVLLRDYGRYDLAQLRFKSGKCLQDNFYVRGDGTRVYFFTQDELKDLFGGVGFQEEQNLVDRRLQVNRGRMLKMYRVWIQTKFRKPNV